MRVEKYSTNEMHNYLIKNKIASISDLKKVLGTETDKTVFRKLKKLSYRSSYSHKGMYYIIQLMKSLNMIIWDCGHINITSLGKK